MDTIPDDVFRYEIIPYITHTYILKRIKSYNIVTLESIINLINLYEKSMFIYLTNKDIYKEEYIDFCNYHNLFYLHYFMFPDLYIKDIKYDKILHLYLKFNNLEYIPKEIFNLSNLEELDLSDNEIYDTPKEIFNLSNLEILNISHNLIEEVSKEISNLSNLKELNLSYNEIIKAPKEICNLLNLEILDLSDNNIEYIPKEIFDLSNLKELDLSGNPLKYTLKELKALSNRLCNILII